MGKVVAIHSFRGGTGKSNLVANCAAMLAQRGHRVGIVDTDIQSPGIHVLFGVDLKAVKYTLNDYLVGKCAIDDAAVDVSHVLQENGRHLEGKIFLLPSSMKVNEITTILSEGYDVGLLSRGYRHLGEAMNLDYVLIDTHPGVNEEILLSIGVSNLLVAVLRLDYQDYQGTALILKIARELEVPDVALVVNKMLPEFDPADIKKQIEDTFQTPVSTVLPLDSDMVRLGSRGIFALHHPDHPVTRALHNVVLSIER
jgi:MinD-like ATPase involved in chromosome partitioning or flagellar assembly